MTAQPQKFIHGGWPLSTDELMRAAVARGDSRARIAADFDVSVSTIRKKLIALGLHKIKKVKRFTPDEDAVLRADYLANIDLEETAQKLGRSYGVLRQRLHHHHRELMNTTRSLSGTRALKRYGARLLEHGATAGEAARCIKEKIVAAKAAARVAALNAKKERASATIKIMLDQIAAGRDRNAAIFEARALGVPLERIGVALDLTRERVRQICDATAFDLAVEQHGVSTQSENPPVERDWLVVAGGKSS